jgi:hypothetical protein
LTAGKYRVFAQDSGEKQKNRKQIFSGGELGEVIVEKGKVASLEKQLVIKERSFGLKYIGFNGQISNIPIPVNSGKTFMIYLGGENLNPKEVTVTSNSPFIKITSIAEPQNFGEEISVLSFNISLKSDTPAGEFSIKVQKNNGEIEYFVGGLANDAVINHHGILNNPMTVNMD